MFNRSATTTNDGMLFPHEVTTIFKVRVPSWSSAAEDRPPGDLRYFLNFGYDYGRDCFKVMYAETYMVVYLRE